MCECAPVGWCVDAPLWLLCSSGRGPHSLLAQFVLQALLEGKSFVRALERSDGLEPSLGLGGWRKETLEFWKPSEPCCAAALPGSRCGSSAAH